MDSQVTVIIPTFNRASILSLVLPSYLNANFVSEILIINDGSTDDTEAVIEKYSKQDSRVVGIKHSVNRGLTASRNTGIDNARGDPLLFSEDDLYLADGSLETLVMHMDQSKADIIGGRRIWMRLGESREQALHRANNSRQAIVNTRFMEHFSHAQSDHDVESPLVNATMLARRRVIEMVKFSDSYPGNAWREESDFQITAQEKGFKVVFCPHAIHYHYDRSMAALGRKRLRANLVYLYWIYKNNRTFLSKHIRFLEENYPDALWLGSPVITSLVYTLYRSLILSRSEFRRARYLRTGNQ